MAKENLSWFSPFETVQHGSFSEGDVKWFLGGKLNVSYNCVDRHALARPDAIALIYEADEPGKHLNVSYAELLRKVCQAANALRKFNIKKGDRVAIYMPNIPEAAIAMLACARIGAVHRYTLNSQKCNLCWVFIRCCP